ncbi:MAG: SRPBCC domain-containing protein, partial [Myxococcales bacterium]|nr:SRPBCC domain-containing protein [Myxococcales bacterium]
MTGAGAPPGPGDQARVSVTVAVPPAEAFAIFTDEIDLWWRRGPRFRMGGRSPGVLQFEARVGGRLFERFPGAGGDAGHVIEIGTVTAWEPPTRLAFTWRNTNFAPDEVTWVEIGFEPVATGTRVVVVHRGWAALRPDHPTRHGRTGAAFSATIGRWWGDLLTALREHAA